MRRGDFMTSVAQTKLEQGAQMTTDKNTGDENSPPPKAKPTTYPGKNDGRISASKHAGVRQGASRPGPKK